VTALDRRLDKRESARSPTDAVVRWLEFAKAHGGFGPDCDYLVQHQEESPLFTLPPLVAAWAGHIPQGRYARAPTDEVERAVRTTLVRVLLVERMNKLICVGRASDEHQVDLLRLLEPLVLAGRVDGPTQTSWINHAGRLLGEVRLWLESAATIGTRYFAGHRPWFQDVAPFLEWVRTSCEEMLAAYTAALARPRGRKPSRDPVDLSLVDQWTADSLEAQIAEPVRVARIDTEVFLAERTREIGISRLIELGEVPPWRP
jgi:hypothetical protein